MHKNLVLKTKDIGMKREINFRVWNPHNREMYNPMPIVDFKVIEINAHVLMQFTGLKDKNGKDIYEGDIIECGATQREINDVIEDGSKVVVSFEAGYFYPFGYNCGWRSEVYVSKILGNIYENPEIL